MWVKKIPKDANSNPVSRSKAWVTMTKKLIDLSRGMAGLYSKKIMKDHGETIKIDFANGEVIKDGSGLLPDPTYAYYEEYINYPCEW